MAKIIEWPPRTGGESARRCTDPQVDRATKADRAIHNAAVAQSSSGPTARAIGFGKLWAVTVTHGGGTAERRGIFVNPTVALWAARELNFWFREARRS